MNFWDAVAMWTARAMVDMLFAGALISVAALIGWKLGFFVAIKESDNVSVPGAKPVDPIPNPPKRGTRAWIRTFQDGTVFTGEDSAITYVKRGDYLDRFLDGQPVTGGGPISIFEDHGWRLVELPKQA